MTAQASGKRPAAGTGVAAEAAWAEGRGGEMQARLAAVLGMGTGEGVGGEARVASLEARAMAESAATVTAATGGAAERRRLGKGERTVRERGACAGANTMVALGQVAG